MRSRKEPRLFDVMPPATVKQRKSRLGVLVLVFLSVAMGQVRLWAPGETCFHFCRQICHYTYFCFLY